VPTSPMLAMVRLEAGECESQERRGQSPGCGAGAAAQRRSGAPYAIYALRVSRSIIAFGDGHACLFLCRGRGAHRGALRRLRPAAGSSSGAAAAAGCRIGGGPPWRAGRLRRRRLQPRHGSGAAGRVLQRAGAAGDGGVRVRAGASGATSRPLPVSLRR
jgi:hypothetical protein